MPERENEVGILIILVLLYLAVEQEFMKMVFRAVLIQSLIAVVAVVYVAVNFLFQLIFVFPLFVGMVMHANEFETKEKQKLTEIKK